jgi:hypothetical protein
MGGNMRKVILVLLVVLVVPVSVYADNTYVVAFDYQGNFTEQNFQKNFSTTTVDGGRQISKLPRDVTQAMEKELAKYSLDVGDVFRFGCIDISSILPTAFYVCFRITSVNRNGTYTYNYYAWQVNAYGR